MGVLKNLHGMTRSEQKEFFDSFDQVLFEIKDSIDGKVNILPDKLSTIKYFGKIKKDVRYLTDNSGSKTETVVDYLHQQNIVTQREDVFRPIESVIAYFKNKGFKKEIFVIGSSLLKEELEHAGFDLAEEVPKEIGKNFRGVFVNNKDNSNVGAVILDHNFNLSFIMLQKAFWCLGSPDCELITINPEKEIVTEQGNILGIYLFNLIFIINKLKMRALSDTKYKEIEIEENFQEILILNGTDEQREDELKKHMNSNSSVYTYTSRRLCR
uniref:Uncharacterized protein LOC114329712 n=1 Tax=Diabrotica virgifera virgifera TaxID=50390 RepID=A0A6P7FP15_DIAVI